MTQDARTQLAMLVKSSHNLEAIAERIEKELRRKETAPEAAVGAAVGTSDVSRLEDIIKVQVVPPLVSIASTNEKILEIIRRQQPGAGGPGGQLNNLADEVKAQGMKFKMIGELARYIGSLSSNLILFAAASRTIDAGKVGKYLVELFRGVRTAMKAAGSTQEEQLKASLRFMESTDTIARRAFSAAIPLSMAMKMGVGRNLMELLKDVGKGLKALPAMDEEKVTAMKSVMGFINRADLMAKTLAKAAPLLKMVEKLHVTATLKHLLDQIGDSVARLGKMQKAEQGVLTMKMMGDSILRFASRMAMAAAPLAVAATLAPLMQWSLRRLASVMTEIDEQSGSIRKGAKALGLMGAASVAFAISMAIVGKTVVQHTMGIAAGLAFTFAAGKVFSKIGPGRKIEEGAKAMGWVALSMGALALGFVALGGVVQQSPQTVGLAILTMSAVGGIFALMGLVSPLIERGAKSMGWVALAFMALSAGLYIFMKLVPVTDWDTLKDVGLVIGASAMVFAVMGIPKVAILIASGAGVAILMGLSFAALGAGMRSIMDVDFDEKKIDGFRSFGWSAVKVYAAAGLASALVIPGAVAMGAIGVSLKSVADGVREIQRVDLAHVDIAGIRRTIAGLADAFAIAGDPKGRAFNLVTFLSGVELGPNNVKRGIDSVMLAGEALKSVVDGLIDFQRRTQGFNLADPKKDPTSLPAKIATTLSVVGKVFADIGASGNTNDSLVAAIFGSDFKKSDTEVGMKSALISGEALKSVAEGLSSFDQMTRTLNLAHPDKDPNSLVARIATVIGVVGKAFADIGASGNTNKSLIGLVFGSDFKKSDTEVGINAVKDVGKNLDQIADSLAKYQDLSRMGIEFDPKKPGVARNIGLVISMVTAAFAGIAKDEGKSGGGILQAASRFLIGTDFSESDVENGIEAVEGVGETLEGIANGIKTFADLQQRKIDIPSISRNIATVLNTVRWSFAAIGGKRTKTGGNSFWTGEPLAENDVEQGIKAVEKSGKTLEDLAKGVSAFADLQGKNINLPRITRNIASVLDMVRQVFAAIGGHRSTNPDFKKINLWPVPDNAVAQGIKSVDGAGEQLKSIGESLKPYIEMKETKKTSQKIADILTTVIREFAAVGDPKVAAALGRTFFSSKAVEAGVGTVKKAAEGMGESADQLGKLQALLSNWDKLKPVMIDIVTVPINTVQRILASTRVEQIEGFALRSFPPIRSMLVSMSDVYASFIQRGAVDRRDKAGKGAMGLFAQDFGLLLNSFRRELSKEQLSSLDRVVTDMERLAKIADPFSRFAKAFGTLAKDMGTYARNFMLMKVDQIRGFSAMASSLVDLSRIDTTRLTMAVQVLSAQPYGTMTDALYAQPQVPQMVAAAQSSGPDIVDAIRNIKIVTPPAPPTTAAAAAAAPASPAIEQALTALVTAVTEQNQNIAALMALLEKKLKPGR